MDDSRSRFLTHYASRVGFDERVPDIVLYHHCEFEIIFSTLTVKLLQKVSVWLAPGDALNTEHECKGDISLSIQQRPSTMT